MCLLHRIQGLITYIFFKSLWHTKLKQLIQAALHSQIGTVNTSSLWSTGKILTWCQSRQKVISELNSVSHKFALNWKRNSLKTPQTILGLVLLPVPFHTWLNSAFSTDLTCHWQLVAPGFQDTLLWYRSSHELVTTHWVKRVWLPFWPSMEASSLSSLNTQDLAFLYGLYSYYGGTKGITITGSTLVSYIWPYDTFDSAYTSSSEHYHWNNARISSPKGSIISSSLVIETIHHIASCMKKPLYHWSKSPVPVTTNSSADTLQSLRIYLCLYLGYDMSP